MRLARTPIGVAVLFAESVAVRKESTVEEGEPKAEVAAGSEVRS